MFRDALGFWPILEQRLKRGAHRFRWLIKCNPHEREKIEFLEVRVYMARTIDGVGIEGLSEFPEGNLWFSDRR